MKTFALTVHFALSVVLLAAQGVPAYKNPALSPDERARDLIGRMTVEEKLGQLLCPMGWEMYEKRGNEVGVSAKYVESMRQMPVGMLWAVFRADPWTRKTLQTGLSPGQAAMAANALQQYAVEHTRLGIPVFIAEESPHGHMAIGTTVFPTAIGMASTWSPSLMERTGAVMAREIRLQGAHIAYGPVMDLSRDARWSRVEESFGEDPVLTAVLASAIVRGAGGGKISEPDAVVSTLKHFAAYGVSEGGLNGRQSVVGMCELHEDFLPPFQAAIDAGALSVMTSYNSFDGVPCTANPYLLTEVLRNRMRFTGFVVSDLFSIEGVHLTHCVAETPRQAAAMSLRAGVDVDLGGEDFKPLLAAVKEGAVPEELLDQAVFRVLRLKFGMGLFENPYVKPSEAAKGVRTSASVALSREVARASVVLLENRNNILPLDRKIKVAVVGPNADNLYNQLGDYTAPQARESVTTVLDGVRSKAVSVEYVKGCAVRDTTENSIAEAVEAARRADVVVAVVGGSSARDFETEYRETGAAVVKKNTVSDMECGEGYDRATLSLPGLQEKLLRELKNTGKPLVVIYIQGRPLEMNWAKENADALLTAWYPGGEGGAAIADVLFGDYNPAGRLPISVPQSVGQLPVHYNRRMPVVHNYVEMSSKPLYPFGYGLSYTAFEYSGLEITQQGRHDFEVTCDVRNTGPRDGEEVPPRRERVGGMAARNRAGSRAG